MATRIIECEKHGFAYRQAVGAIQGTIGSVEALEYADTELDYYCPGCREEEEIEKKFVPKKKKGKKNGNT